LSSSACFIKIDAVCYGSVAEAYLAPPASGTATLLAQSRIFNEPLNFGRNVIITMNGGYNAAFSSTTGTTELRGVSMTVISGSVVIGNNVSMVIAK
jgi:hypothetical protein